uniref:RIC1 domain-containing protein n=1 Tax=Heterorhabditis bacteriophora TaxID=37862 RepID=A0A1I7XPF5_HETBA
MRGHSEHRSNAWKPEEIYMYGSNWLYSKNNWDCLNTLILLFRTCVQALEGRCSRRSKLVYEQKIAVKEFIAKVEVILLNELGRSLEQANEPDRRLISRLNRALTSFDLKDDRPHLYHVPSPSRPAWKTWNLDYEDPQKHTAELIAQTLGARIAVETASMFSRTTSPDRKSAWSEPDGRRRGNSVDSARKALPLEPNVFVRDRPSVTSFRERSVPSDETNTGRESFGHHIHKPLPQHHLPLMDAFLKRVSELGHLDRISSLDQFVYKRFLRNLARIHWLFPTAVVVCVYITNLEGKIDEHVLVKNSSASSVAIDEKNDIMYVSIMQSKGRSVHVFDIANNFKKIDAISCPKDPKIEMSRTRWLTVGPRGQLFMVSGDNVKSALWSYVRGRKGWKILKESRKTRYQYLSVAEDQAEYKAVVLLTCDAANNRLLLFVVDHSLSLINEYDLSKTYRLGEHISSPASAVVDKHGNLLVLDYANGKLWILLSGVKGIRRLKQIHFEDALQPQEALGISVMGDDVLVACFNRREIRFCQYLEGGVFRSTQIMARSPSLCRRSTSLPRPPESRKEQPSNVYKCAKEMHFLMVEICIRRHVRPRFCNISTSSPSSHTCLVKMINVFNSPIEASSIDEFAEGRDEGMRNEEAVFQGTKRRPKIVYNADGRKVVDGIITGEQTPNALWTTTISRGVANEWREKAEGGTLQRARRYVSSLSYDVRLFLYHSMRFHSTEFLVAFNLLLVLVLLHVCNII